MRDLQPVNAPAKRRLPRWIWVATLVAALGGTALMWWFTPDRVLSDDPIPDPLEPFGLTKHSDVVFRWTIPSDGTPVYAEVLDMDLNRLWISKETGRGAVRLEVKAGLPLGALVWRPVGIGPGGERRTGDAATFDLFD